MTFSVQKIRVVDSHTEGEPTRTITDGFPSLGEGSLQNKLERFRSSFDNLRQAVVKEPRGHEAIVGALLCESNQPDCEVGVIFFNNVGYLNMCGHGTIGVIKTLEHLGQIESGTHRIETPVGTVEAYLDEDGYVTIENVPSYRYRKDVEIVVPKYGKVTGDVAWGGNWFFLVESHDQRISGDNIKQLTEYSICIKNELGKQEIRGEHDEEIDHIELFSQTKTADSRNFVLCPGGEYDRSPCGTGTSAKLACLFESGKLKEGEVWRQESVIGSSFEGKIKIVDGKIIPIIKGSAYVVAESELVLDPNDPFRYGIN